MASILRAYSLQCCPVFSYIINVYFYTWPFPLTPIHSVVSFVLEIIFSYPISFTYFYIWLSLQYLSKLLTVSDVSNLCFSTFLLNIQIKFKKIYRIKPYEYQWVYEQYSYELRTIQDTFMVWTIDVNVPILLYSHLALFINFNNLKTMAIHKSKCKCLPFSPLHFLPIKF